MCNASYAPWLFKNMPAGIAAVAGWLGLLLFSAGFLLLLVVLVLLYFYGGVLSFLENLVETWDTSILNIQITVLLNHACCSQGVKSFLPSFCF